MQYRKKAGRPKNTVFVKGVEKGMTTNQYKKYMISNSLSKSEVIKQGILKKSELEKAIATRELPMFTIGRSHRIPNVALQEYVNNHG